MTYEEYRKNVETVTLLKEQLRELSMVSKVEEKLAVARHERVRFDTYFETGWKEWIPIYEAYIRKCDSKMNELVTAGKMRHDQDPMTCWEYVDFLGERVETKKTHNRAPAAR